MFLSSHIGHEENFYKLFYFPWWWGHLINFWIFQLYLVVWSSQKQRNILSPALTSVFSNESEKFWDWEVSCDWKHEVGVTKEACLSALSSAPCVWLMDVLALEPKLTHGCWADHLRCHSGVWRSLFPWPEHLWQGRHVYLLDLAVEGV